MRKLLLVALIGSLLTSCASVPVPPHDNHPVPAPKHSVHDPRFNFQGVWQGTLGGFNAPHYVDSVGYPIEFKFVISQSQIHVYNMVNGAWHEMKPGGFWMVNLGSEALLYSISSGDDQDGVWVESSTFTLSHTAPDQLVVYWQRTVNNLDLPKTAQWYQFAWGYSGVMHRVSVGS